MMAGLLSSLSYDFLRDTQFPLGSTLQLRNGLHGMDNTGYGSLEMQLVTGVAFLLLSQQKLLESWLLSLLRSQVSGLPHSLRTWHNPVACK